MNEIRYPKTMAAMQAEEASQWAIGDALIEECSGDGYCDGSTEKLKEVAADAFNLIGREYAWTTLRELKNIARRFPPGTRVPGLGWTAHNAASNPEMLTQLIASMPPGEKLTERKARALMQQMRAKADEQIDAEIEAVNTQSEQTKRGTRSSKARQVAEIKAAAIQEYLEEQKGRTPTPNLVPEHPEAVSAMLAAGTLMQSARTAMGAARKAQQVWQEHSKSLPPNAIAEFVAEARRVYSAWHDFVIAADRMADSARPTRRVLRGTRAA